MVFPQITSELNWRKAIIHSMLRIEVVENKDMYEVKKRLQTRLLQNMGAFLDNYCLGDLSIYFIHHISISPISSK